MLLTSILTIGGCVPVKPPIGTTNLVKSVTVLDDKGGRLSVSHDGTKIAYDKRGEDGYFDTWTMNIDGSDKKCITCDHPVLPNRNVGQPDWHPSGQYLVVQAEKQEHHEGIASALSANPGAGVYNDLWIIEHNSDRAWLVNEVPQGKDYGVLHPHFSNDGGRLSWSEMFKAPNIFNEATLAGSWKLKVADVDLAEDGSASLKNVKTYLPGDEVIYENHGFSPDGNKLIFTTNLNIDQSIHTCDIYTLDLQTEELTSLTNIGYNEHGQFSPDGSKIIWMSTNGNIEPDKVKQVSYTDWWIMNVDGSNKQRLTYFNRIGHPHFVFWGTCAADFAWLPDGSGFIGYYFTFSLTNFQEVTVAIDLN